ncbi:MAG: GGDEF domain-containing protein [Rubrivivax sp.]|nr:GGDEF domain-containing protein [Rubrivivax sp.]
MRAQDDPWPRFCADAATGGCEVPDGRRAVDAVEEMAAAFRATGAAIAITDAGLRIVAVNDAYADADAAGRTADELCGTTVDSDVAAAALAAAPQAQELTLHRGDGHRRTMWLRVDMLRDTAGQVQRYVFTFTDISLLKQEQEALRHQTQHDDLTGLPNRVLLADELLRCMARAQRHARPMALMFIDIDHFKRVNDSLGHGVGDALLRGFAQRLRHTLRAEDFVARLSGDEFIAVIEDLHAEADAVAIAQSILAGLALPFEIDGHVLNISASIGIARFPGDAHDAAGLTRAADAAMYLAKQHGRARFRFSDDGARVSS